MYKKNLIPNFRAMIHRKTGIVVGPPVPVFKEDWPFCDPMPSQLLWRYMDLHKFEDILRSRLYFSRPDKFKDPFEGLFKEANLQGPSESDAAFYQAYRIPYNPEETLQNQRTYRNCVFISCWHMNSRETTDMWKAYTQSSESVVIVTSAKALYKYIPGNIIKSKVLYTADDFSVSEFSHNSIFFYKPKSYGIENEFRMLRVLEEGESVTENNPEDFGRKVPINLKILHRVIAHPQASSEFVKNIDDLLTIYCPRIRCEKSSLLMT